MYWNYNETKVTIFMGIKVGHVILRCAQNLGTGQVRQKQQAERPSPCHSERSEESRPASERDCVKRNAVWPVEPLLECHFECT